MVASIYESENIWIFSIADNLLRGYGYVSELGLIWILCFVLSMDFVWGDHKCCLFLVHSPRPSLRGGGWHCIPTAWATTAQRRDPWHDSHLGVRIHSVLCGKVTMRHVEGVLWLPASADTRPFRFRTRLRTTSKTASIRFFLPFR